MREKIAKSTARAVHRGTAFPGYGLGDAQALSGARSDNASIGRSMYRDRSDILHIQNAVPGSDAFLHFVHNEGG